MWRLHFQSFAFVQKVQKAFPVLRQNFDAVTSGLCFLNSQKTADSIIQFGVCWWVTYSKGLGPLLVYQQPLLSLL